MSYEHKSESSCCPSLQNSGTSATFVDGRIVEDWVLVDSLGVYQQLDLIPTSEDLIAAAAGHAKTG